MTALYAAIAMLGYLWAFWLLYVLTMGLYRASLSKKLTRLALVLASPVVILAILVDLLANWTLAALWFRELPPVAWGRPDLVTDRLTRYIAGPDGWRQQHAQWLCRNLLDYFDPSGVHCK